MKKLKAFDLKKFTPKACRTHRLRWGIEPDALSGRADVARKTFADFEAARLYASTEIRVSIAKALRQMMFERAQELIETIGPEIAADPDAKNFTREAAALRRAQRYRSYSTFGRAGMEVGFDVLPSAAGRDDVDEG